MHDFRKLLLCLTSLIAVTYSPAAYAKPLKLAFVDMTRVLNEANESKAKKKELDRLSLDARKKIEEKKKKLSEMQNKLKDKDLSSNSPEIKAFRQQAKDFERFVKDTDEELRQNFVSFNTKITKKALGLIETYSEKHALDLVLDKSEGGKSPVLFGSGEADITDAIITQMNGSKG